MHDTASEYVRNEEKYRKAISAIFVIKVIATLGLILLFRGNANVLFWFAGIYVLLSNFAMLREQRRLLEAYKYIAGLSQTK